MALGQWSSTSNAEGEEEVKEKRGMEGGMERGDSGEEGREREKVRGREKGREKHYRETHSSCLYMSLSLSNTGNQSPFLLSKVDALY